MCASSLCHVCVHLQYISTSVFTYTNVCMCVCAWVHACRCALWVCFSRDRCSSGGSVDALQLLDIVLHQGGASPTYPTLLNHFLLLIIVIIIIINVVIIKIIVIFISSINHCYEQSTKRLKESRIFWKQFSGRPQFYFVYSGSISQSYHSISRNLWPVAFIDFYRTTLWLVVHGLTQ